MSGEPKYLVYVDTREPESIYRGLQAQPELEPVWRRLEAGDYYIPAERCSLLIERKTVTDYLDSLFDARLWGELERVKGAEAGEGRLIPMLLIEGDWRRVLRFGKREVKDAVGWAYSSLLSAIVSWGFQVVSSPSLSWTPYILASFTKWLGRPRKSGPPVYKPKAESLDEMALRVLCSLPHISVERARRILARYGSVREALGRVEGWKEEVEGIGDKIVADVKAVLIHRVGPWLRAKAPGQ
jgi:ERCC4-type nuclease